MDDTQLSKKSNQKLHLPGRFGYLIYQNIWSCIDLIFPPVCGGCERKGSRWCGDCDSEVELIHHPICPICGQPQMTQNACSQCQQVQPKYRQLRSWAIFTGNLRNAIHRLKYFRDITLAEIFSRQLIELIADLNWQIDLIVPVPLSNERQKSRGYNQAALIALPISIGLKIKYQPKALLRVKETSSQIGLSRIQRHENVSGAFMSDFAIVSSKHILIIDDVVTSGATLNECAKALLISGAQDVYAVTLARAMYN